MNKQDTEKQGTPLFEDHVKSAVHHLRGTLAELITSVASDPGLPQEMARRFNLKQNLAWRVSKFVCEPDPYASIPHIPGKQSLNALLNAFQKAGASTKALAAVRTAMKEYDRMVELHAGDRTTLEMMLGNLTRDGEQQRNEGHRKLSYLGNSATYGVQARVQLTVNIIAPSQVEDKVDLAWLCGLVDFRRLRYNIPWAVAMARKFETNGSSLDVGTIEPIDPDFADPGTAPLMGKFCGDPVPEVRSVPTSNDMLRFEIMDGPVGNTAAATGIVGLFGRAFITRYRYDTNVLGEHIARLSTPSEILIHDLFVHEDLDYAFSPRIALYNQLPSAPEYPASGRDQGLLPVEEKVIELGRGPSGLMTVEIPQYKSMIEAVYDRLGWEAGRFHGFRFKMRYPPIPALAVLRYDLTGKPSG